MKAKADPRDDAELLARKEELEKATEEARLAFCAYRDRMQSDERKTLTDDVRLHVEELADAVMAAEGRLGERASQLGMFPRFRSRPLVRTDLWSGMLYLQDSVWDAQCSKIVIEQELEEKQHLAVASLHEIMALEVRTKRTGDAGAKDSLKRARLTAKDRIAEVFECKRRLAEVTSRATPSDGGGFGFAMAMRPVQQEGEFPLDPLDDGTKERLAMSCRTLLH